MHVPLMPSRTLSALRREEDHTGQEAGWRQAHKRRRNHYNSSTDQQPDPNLAIYSRSGG